MTGATLFWALWLWGVIEWSRLAVKHLLEQGEER